jgi:hypothetical protein
MPQAGAEQLPRKRSSLPRKTFQATAVVKFEVELSLDLEDALEAAKYFLEEELGFDSPRVLCVEKPAHRRKPGTR